MSKQFVTSALEKGQHGLQKHFSIQLTVHKSVSGRWCAFRNTAALHRIKQQLSAGFGIPAGPALCAGWAAVLGSHARWARFPPASADREVFPGDCFDCNISSVVNNTLGPRKGLAKSIWKVKRALLSA